MLDNKFNDEKTNKFLDFLMNLSYNKKCADCEKPNPSWASLSYGLFICYECASVHRGIGKVKSTQLDNWNLDELRRMHSGGNRRLVHIPTGPDRVASYTPELISELDNKVKESEVKYPGDSFMASPTSKVNKPTRSISIEKKAKPKFSDVVDESSEELQKPKKESKPKKEEKPVKEAVSEETESEILQVTTKPNKNLKKSLDPSRSPFSFTVKEHENDL